MKLGIARHFIKLSDELIERANNILEPLVNEALETKDLEIIKKLIEKLPHGFYRSELQTYVNLHTPVVQMRYL